MTTVGQWSVMDVAVASRTRGGSSGGTGPGGRTVPPPPLPGRGGTLPLNLAGQRLRLGSSETLDKGTILTLPEKGSNGGMPDLAPAKNPHKTGRRRTSFANPLMHSLEACSRKCSWSSSSCITSRMCPQRRGRMDQGPSPEWCRNLPQ